MDWTGPSLDLAQGDLCSIGDGRLPARADGRRLRYLGGTAWEPFHRTPAACPTPAWSSRARGSAPPGGGALVPDLPHGGRGAAAARRGRLLGRFPDGGTAGPGALRRVDAGLCRAAAGRGQDGGLVLDAAEET